MLSHRLLLAPGSRVRGARRGRARRARASPGPLRPAGRDAGDRHRAPRDRPLPRRRHVRLALALRARAWRWRCSPAGAAIWVPLAARGATVTRSPGPPRVVEDEPYPLRVELRTGLLPAPGGELIEPLLGWPVSIAGRYSRRVRINVRFSRRGRRVLEPGRLVIRDPLRMCERVVIGEGEEEVLVLPRVEPVTAPGGGGAGAGAEAGIGAAPGPRGPEAGRVHGRARDRRPARVPGGVAGIAHPLAHGRAARRDGGAPHGGRAGLGSARGAGQLGARRARRRSTWRCARPARSACTWPARAAARSCFPASAARWRSGTTWAPGRPCTCASRSSSRAPPPPVARARPARRRGALGHGGRPRWAPRARSSGCPPRARFVVTPERAAGSVGGLRGRGLQRLQAGPGRPEGGRVSGALAQPPAARRRPARDLPAARSAAPARDTLPLRLAAFTALAAFGAGHWAGLVADAPVGRMLLQVAAVTAGAAALGAARPRPAPAGRGAGAGVAHHARDVRGGAGRGGPVAQAPGPARLGRARPTASPAASRASRRSTGPTRARTSGSG